MTLRDKMQQEQQAKTLYKQAQNYAFEYADEALLLSLNRREGTRIDFEKGRLVISCCKLPHLLIAS